MVNEITVANLKLSRVTTEEFLEAVKTILNHEDKQAFITTPNSEFLYAALRDKNAEQLLNQADIAIVDGVGVFWAERFLSLPFASENKFLRWLQAGWQVIVTGSKVLLQPKYLYTNIPEKITGSNVIYDLAKLCARERKSMYLLGNWGDSSKKAAEKLVELNPGLKIAGYSNKTGDDPTVLEDLKAAKPDLLLVGFGPIRQEKWILDNLKNLPVKAAMGVGGSFDYTSGNKAAPPKWIRDIGLEWLFRLVTQFRFRRVYNAVIGLITETMKYKVNNK